MVLPRMDRAATQWYGAATEPVQNQMVREPRYGMVQRRKNSATEQEHNGMDQQQSMEKMEYSMVKFSSSSDGMKRYSPK